MARDLPDPVLPRLPADDPLRRVTHDEVHARPSTRLPLPSRVIYVAVIHEGVDRRDELQHLRELPGLQGLMQEDLQASFLKRSLPGGLTLTWERHSEFTRCALVLPKAGVEPGCADPASATPPATGGLPPDWLARLPGRTFAAIDLWLLEGSCDPLGSDVAAALSSFADADVVASSIAGTACVTTDFGLRADGFECMRVLAAPGTTPTRAGRLAQRLLDLETYRLMALRGLPVAKALTPLLQAAERDLASITARLEDAASSDRELLDALLALSARVERATAEHGFRFTATRAYDALVRQRIEELQEVAMPGRATIGQFMQRRLWPAIATVAAAEQRLASLSARVERASALLRTRVDIAAETRSQQLLQRLTQGQALQLRLQTTVEGLSIAAISYYVVSLLLYLLKAGKSAGLPLNPELVAGSLIPLVLFAVWRTSRALHHRILGAQPGGSGP